VNHVGTGSLTRPAEQRSAAESGTLFLSTQQNASSAQTPVPFRHEPTRKTIHLKKDLMEVLAKRLLKPFEALCPRMKPRGRG
jgi:hypothetical protein